MPPDTPRPASPASSTAAPARPAVAAAAPNPPSLSAEERETRRQLIQEMKDDFEKLASQVAEVTASRTSPKSTAAPSAAPPNSSRFAKWKPVWESALTAAIVSALMGAFGLVWLESRLENSKEHVAAIVQQKDKFESTQSNVFTQIALYTNKLFAKPDTADKDQLQAAIIATLLQLNSLKDSLPQSDHVIVDKYATELQNLSKQVREIKTVNDLGPLYASAQNLLQLNDELNERLKDNMDVSIFPWRRS